MIDSMHKLAHLAEALRSGALPLQDYLDWLESRMREHGPQVKAFLLEEGRFERLRMEARVLSERYPEPYARPALYGIPVAVKDIFNVSGFETRAGSRLPAAEFAGPQAESVTRLKNAGALILGKTVTAEFAYIAPGETRNPHNLRHTPGGSSSGSAAAVGAGMCALALGTQTVGSINRPAAYCGVVGFKPGYGRVSRLGVVPVSESLDHVGFFTSDADSAALAATVLVSGWRHRRNSHKPVLAVPAGPYLDKVSPPGLENFEEVCTKLQAAGYEVRRISVMPDFEDIRQHHFTIMTAEAARVHANWYKLYADLYRQESKDLILAGREVSGPALEDALTSPQKLRNELMAVMDETGVDLWLAPAATGVAPHGLASTGDSIMNLPWTHCGLPTLGLPSGKDAEGLPFGVQVVGRWCEDETLMAWAREIQNALGTGNRQ
jgi:Asp-tRNA(Asn)/Glu-tRNA(Gln) amidotransferase A subunit family amidase